MSWYSVTPEDRLVLWKTVRTNIIDLSIEDQLRVLAEFCESMPRSKKRSFDLDNFADWPTPWETLFHAKFCVNSISLIIFYTLLIIDSDCDPNLWIVKDNSGDYLLPIINNRYVLNYEVGKVSNYPDIYDYFIIMKKFSKKEIKAIK